MSSKENNPITMLKVKTYRRPLSGLGAAPKRVDTSKIRVVKNPFWEQTEIVLTYEEFLEDFRSQGGIVEEATELLREEMAFETETAFYYVSHGLSKDSVRDLFHDLIDEHLDQCSPSATPNVCEMISSPQGRENAIEAIYQILFRDYVGVGASINALEEQLA